MTFLTSKTTPLTAIALFAGTLSLVACGGGPKPVSAGETANEVDQLIALYTDAKTKFVVQKQQMVAEEGCARIKRISAAIDKRAEKAAMSTDDTGVITKIQMEFSQALKSCQAKD